MRVNPPNPLFQRGRKTFSKFKNNVYYKKNREELFCPVCFNNEGKLNPLQSIAKYDWDYEYKSCEKPFYVYKKEPEIEVNRR